MKYIIDIPDEILEFMNGKFNFFIEPEVKVGECRHYKVRLDDTEATPYTEPSQKAIDLQHAHDIENVARMNYNKGAEDAWELARRIICPSDCCEDSISKYTEKFLGIPSYKARAIFKDLSYQEVKVKYDAWKKQKTEICVGDEVIPLDTQYDTMVVTKLWTSEYCDEWVDTIAGDGKTYNFLKTSINKTGRHFDEVEELLKKMGDESYV